MPLHLSLLPLLFPSLSFVYHTCHSLIVYVTQLVDPTGRCHPGCGDQLAADLMQAGQQRSTK